MGFLEADFEDAIEAKVMKSLMLVDAVLSGFGNSSCLKNTIVRSVSLELDVLSAQAFAFGSLSALVNAHVRLSLRLLPL